MKEDRPSQTSAQEGGSTGWLERLGQALVGEIDSKEALINVLRKAEKRNVIGIDVLAMLEGVLQVTEMQVRDIMIPRKHMVILERDMTADSILNIIVESAHSRFPVIGDNRDDVEGIILAKDLIQFYASQTEKPLDIREFLRPAVFIPESKRLNALLKDFRSNRNHIAIVVDEYGGVSGLITIEDVLEQIVGNIEDEHDVDEDSYILNHGNGVFTVQALTPIEDFNESFGTEFSDEEFDTISGLVLKEFGYMPRRGEEIKMGDLLFRVVRSDQRRLHLLKVIRQAPSMDN